MYEYDDQVEAVPNAVVEIRSTQCDYAGSGLFEAMVSTAYGDEPEEAAAESDGEYFFRGEGWLEDDGKNFELFYREGTDDADAWFTSVSFAHDSPGIITVKREGECGHSFVIEAGTRNYSVYSTPYGPIEMCVWGRRVDNGLGEHGGVLSLDYTVELKGMTAQRTKMNITAKCRQP